MEVLNDVLGYKNRKIYQNDEYFKFSLDGVLLANFVTLKLTTKKIIDIGTGTGIIPLILSLKTKVKIDAIEIQKELCQLLTKTIKYNKLETQINLINDDIKIYAENKNFLNTYDIVISNPPYFSKTKINTVKENAKHENLLTLEDLITASKKLLKNNGSLYLVYDSSKFIEMIRILEKNNLCIKKLQFVYETSEKESSIFLLECTKNGKASTKVLPPFILFEKSGIMTEMYQKISFGSE